MACFRWPWIRFISLRTAWVCSGLVAAWAASYTGFLRAFTEAILAPALSDEASARDSLVEQVYQRVRRRLTADPERYAFRYISVGALLTRL